MKSDATSPKVLLVIGGASDIGRAAAQAFAVGSWHIQLAGRDLVALQREADDITVRTGAMVTAHSFDALDPAAFNAFTDALPVLPDAVLCVVGLLGDQRRGETDIDHAVLVMRSNYEGPALILGALAERFMARGSGVIIGVSSVAGDRGRASNYVYGSAKAGLSAFLSGLRNRLSTRGVRVITVKPGFVRTKMTAGINLPKQLTSSPSTVGEAIFTAVTRESDVIYVSKPWEFIMTLICMVPEPIFKRLNL